MLFQFARKKNIYESLCLCVRPLIQQAVGRKRLKAIGETYYHFIKIHLVKIRKNGEFSLYFPCI